MNPTPTVLSIHNRHTPMQIAIYGTRRQQSHILSILALIDELAANGVDILMPSKLYNYLHAHAPRGFRMARLVAAD